jgi:hypothetical protein
LFIESLGQEGNRSRCALFFPGMDNLQIEDVPLEAWAEFGIHAWPNFPADYPPPRRRQKRHGTSAKRRT